MIIFVAALFLANTPLSAIMFLPNVVSEVDTAAAFFNLCAMLECFQEITRSFQKYF